MIYDSSYDILIAILDKFGITGNYGCSYSVLIAILENLEGGSQAITVDLPATITESGSIDIDATVDDDGTINL